MNKLNFQWTKNGGYSNVVELEFDLCHNALQPVTGCSLWQATACAGCVGVLSHNQCSLTCSEVVADGLALCTCVIGDVVILWMSCRHFVLVQCCLWLSVPQYVQPWDNTLDWYITVCGSVYHNMSSLGTTHWTCTGFMAQHWLMWGHTIRYDRRV